jgi:predicted helicase
MPQFFPNKNSSNFIISVSGTGSNKDYSVLMTNIPTDYQVQFNTQCFPLYYYEEQKKSSKTLFDGAKEKTEFVRRDGITNFILEQAQKVYGARVNKEDIFYYVYGLLHSPDYRTRFTNDLKKMLPRIPLVDEPKDFWAFSKAGRKLADLHINYESVPPAEGVIVKGAESGFFKVEKMRFPAKTDKNTIIYNSQITISNIPAEAYEYVVNGKSAIEWLMERYQITTNKDSGIKNDPNDWADEVGKPRYIRKPLAKCIFFKSVFLL